MARRGAQPDDFSDMRLLRRTALLAAVMAAPFAVSSAQAASNTVPLACTHSIVVDAANSQVFI